MQNNLEVEGTYPPEVRIVQLGGRRIILVGTAHVSQKSAELVRRVIEQERPDCVCIELDQKRYDSLAKKQRWESMDLKQIIRRKQLSTLVVNLILASYQKKMGAQLGVIPGSELIEAAQAAQDKNIPVALCDREARVTLRRAWRATSFWKKSYLLANLAASLFDNTELSEEKLAELKKQDVLTELLNELGESLPELKRVIIDERDTFLAEKIKAAEGKKLVAVVGAGHLEGTVKALHEDRSAQLADIDSIPPISVLWKVLGWSIPAVIIASIAFIGWHKGGAAAGANIIYWILANGIPSAIGAALALAHPWTILGAFAAAPITSLTPVIGAGYVTAFIQVMVRPPVVKEFETVLEDMGTWRGWWRNKLLKVLMAFLLPGFGSMIGTWVGGARIVSNVF
ncbi:Pheromone shutdown protein [hydrothermal vent metagenome]|uniref:Pheromone shutdown protein n=1 Tax=hydrothermal vent metagenome TaxID=652676 RepID=A0A3B0UNN5_9ZZZZ